MPEKSLEYFFGVPRPEFGPEAVRESVQEALMAVDVDLEILSGIERELMNRRSDTEGWQKLNEACGYWRNKLIEQYEHLLALLNRPEVSVTASPNKAQAPTIRPGRVGGGRLKAANGD